MFVFTVYFTPGSRPFLCGSCLLMTFLLQNITRCYNAMFSHISLGSHHVRNPTYHPLLHLFLRFKKGTQGVAIKSHFCLFQSVLLSTSIAVFYVQFPAANGQVTSMGPAGNAPTSAAIQGTNSKQPLGKRSLNTDATNLTPTKAFVTKTVAHQLPTSKAIVRSKSSTGNTTKPNQGPWPNSGVSVKRPRRKINYRVRTRRRARKRRKGWLTRRRSRKRKGGVKKVIISNNGTMNATARNRTKPHPCNSVQASGVMYKVNNIECRRWHNSELQQQMNCLGMFNHQYLATSFQEAMKFKDLDTGRKLDLSKSFILSRQSSHRQKRNVQIDPGETLIVQCHGGKTPTENGHLRICPVCMAITRQPSTPRRFPEYFNELMCDPQMVSNYLPGIDAFCVQKTFTLDLLQFDGDWELDSALSAEAGHDVYTEKWELYTQTIRRHCACELLPSSPMANLL